MRFGKLWAKCWGLALADFGRDQSSSDSLRGSRNVFCEVNNARFHRYPIGNTFLTFEHNNVNRCHHVNFRDRILIILTYGVVFPKKRKNCCKHFQVLWLQAVITPQWLQIPKTHGQIIPNFSIFTVKINSKSFPGIVRCAPEAHPQTFSRFS